MSDMRFIVDHNVGKLVRWLRMMGYDSLFFDGEGDRPLVRTALAEDRVILTRDTQIMKMGVIASGRVRALLIESDRPSEQVRQVIKAMKLDSRFRPFSLCLECNRLLEERSSDQVRDRVPPYVFRTQRQYRECPFCHRIYWQGTHWQAMNRTLENIVADSAGEVG